MVKPIYIITTGGAIDAAPGVYDPEDVKLLEHSLVPEAFREVCPDQPFDYLDFIKKDSRDITEQDSQNLAKIINESDYEYIMVTQGTDAMPQNARRLQEILGDTPKKIIFTGSMIPLSSGKESDAYINLEFSMKIFSTISKGVRVVMNKKIWKLENNFGFTRLHHSQWSNYYRIVKEAPDEPGDNDNKRPSHVPYYKQIIEKKRKIHNS